MSRSRASRTAVIFATLAAAGLSFGYQPQHASFVAQATAQTPQGMASSDAVPGTGPSASEPNLAPVTLSPQRMQSIGVKTGVLEFRPVRDEIRTVGNVEVDETRISDVQIRFAGWVQKVYADAMYKQVRQGQPLLTIYSPELVMAEQEYLVAKELLAKTTVPGGAAGAHGSQSLLDAATERLKRWQVPDREIARLKKSGKIRHEIEIDSPASGFIIDRKAFPNMYVQPGTRLYSVADLSTVWVYAEIFQSDIGRVKVGDPASITVDSYPDQTFPARVSFIWPQVDQTTRRARSLGDPQFGNEAFARDVRQCPPRLADGTPAGDSGFRSVSVRHAPNCVR